MKLRAAGLAILLASPALAADPPGKAIFDKNCAQCHGEAGDGKGVAAVHLMPKPRDFTSGKFKIRSTGNGELPTDDDLKNIIRRGMPYTSMPPWPQFTDAELTQLVAYVKTFHDGFKSASPKPVELPAAPAFSQDSADKGAKSYAAIGCAGCHGETGHTDGPAAPALADEWGNPIRPANLSQRWTFRGGGTREDIFRTLSTGLNGTPMPSFKDALSVEDRWHLVDYIASLGDSETPNYSTLVVAAPVEEDIDVEKTATSLLEKATAVRLPIVGQIMEPGRQFHPQTSSILVRAVYDQQKIAFQVRWDDMKADTQGRNAPDLQVPIAEEEEGGAPAAAAGGGDDIWGGAAAPAPAASAAPPADVWGDQAEGAAPAVPADTFSDAVALQLPVSIPAGAQKPYFLFGDSGDPVDLWFLDLGGGANRLRQYAGRGSGALTVLEGAEAEGRAKYDKGTWSAVFVRDLRSTTGISFAEDQFVPIAFSVWDGSSRDRGNKRGLTQWFYVYVPPREKPSSVVPVALAAGAMILFELAVVFGLRRRRRRRLVSGTPPVAEPV